jgi:hypothetical protein
MPIILLMIMTIAITWFAFIIVHLLQTYLQVCSPPSMTYSHKHHMFKHMNFFAMDALHVVLTIWSKWWKIGSNKDEIHQHHVNCEHNEMFALIKCNTKWTHNPKAHLGFCCGTLDQYCIWALEHIQCMIAMEWQNGQRYMERY